MLVDLVARRETKMCAPMMPLGLLAFQNSGGQDGQNFLLSRF